MKKILFISLGIILIVFSSCTKNTSTFSIFIGTVIGFDQCNVNPADSFSRGYIVKIQSIVNKDTIAVDTAITYNLPDIFVFHPQIFMNFQSTNLFPLEYRNKYTFRLSYVNVPEKEAVYPSCAMTTYYAWNFYNIHRQIIITKFYDTTPWEAIGSIDTFN